MQAQVSNAYVRELQFERDALKQRCLQLSQSLDENDQRYKAILFSLGFDEHGTPLPKEPGGEPAELTGVPAVAADAGANEQPAGGQLDAPPADPVQAWADAQMAPPAND